MKIIAALLLLFTASVACADEFIARNGYGKIEYIDDSFDYDEDALPSIAARFTYTDKGDGSRVRPTVIKTVAIEGCEDGEGKIYFSGEGQEPSEDIWDAADDFATDELARYICRLDKQYN